MEFLNEILHSKRANLYYIEKCKIVTKNNNVTYLTSNEKNKNEYWNIPIANTTVIILGLGTSISQSAVRLLSKAGVLIGFAGNEGESLYAGNEIEWFTPRLNYRPTKYVQSWCSFWYDKTKRLEIAKKLLLYRIDFFNKMWKSKDLYYGYKKVNFSQVLETFDEKINKAKNTEELTSAEAHFVKALYGFAAIITEQRSFKRNFRGKDDINIFLNIGHHLTYGLAASTLWVLGIPQSFGIIHGETRKGSLIFDVADLVKCSVILPIAFLESAQKTSIQDFRKECLYKLKKHNCMDFMFNSIKNICMEL